MILIRFNSNAAVFITLYKLLALILLYIFKYLSQRNVPPRSREMKRALNDKESLEKTRLANRKGGHFKAEPFVPGVGSASLTRMEHGAPGYCPESDRFDTDSAAAEKLIRDARIIHDQEINDKKRMKAVEREEERWRYMDEKAKYDEERFLFLRDYTDKGKPNLSSVPYNPITLKYNDSKDGMLLKHADDSIKYRAAVRAKNLQSKMTADGYNKITGEQLNLLQVPNKPESLPIDFHDIGKFNSDGTFNRSIHAHPEKPVKPH
jgi:hypothetical protein